MQPISCMTANYVARPLNYNMTGGWAQGDSATNAHFRPIETYAERLESYLLDVKRIGFEAIDFWLPVLHWQWATDEHVAVARDLLSRHNLQLVSLAGDFGTNRTEFEAACQLARNMNVRILGGVTPMLDADRDNMLAILREYDVVLGYENHAEKTPQEVLRRIGEDAPEHLGTTVDTGWYGTHGYHAADAIRELGERIVHMHLKDIEKAGEHETCVFGEGVVPLEACVQAMKDIHYSGAITLEHEPADHDPTDEIAECYSRLKNWL